MIKEIYSVLGSANKLKSFSGFAFMLTVVLSVFNAQSAAAAPYKTNVVDGSWYVSVSDAQCQAVPNGGVLVNFSPASGAMVTSYDLLSGATVVASDPNGQFPNLAAGSYQVRASMDNGDVATYEQNVTVGTQQVYIIPIVDQVAGNIQLFVPSDNGSYTYSWSNGATTRNISGVDPGSYTVTVGTGGGCSTSQSIQMPGNVASGNGGGNSSGGTTLPSSSNLNLTTPGSNVGIGLAQGSTPQAMLHLLAPASANASQPDRRVIWVSNGAGTSTADAAFAVYNNGFVYAREVQVKTVNPWPDYVFGTEHSRLPLNDLGTYLARNRHLPGIPSATEVERNGQSLGEMQRLLLEKIEEQSLYIVELHQRVAELEKRLADR